MGMGVTPNAQGWGLSMTAPREACAGPPFLMLCYWTSHAGHCNPKLLCGSEDEFLSHTISIYYKHFRQDAFLVLRVDKYLYFCYLNFLS